MSVFKAMFDTSVFDDPGSKLKTVAKTLYPVFKVGFFAFDFAVLLWGVILAIDWEVVWPLLIAFGIIIIAAVFETLFEVLLYMLSAFGDIAENTKQLKGDVKAIAGKVSGKAAASLLTREQRERFYKNCTQLEGVAEIYQYACEVLGEDPKGNYADFLEGLRQSKVDEKLYGDNRKFTMKYIKEYLQL